MRPVPMPMDSFKSVRTYTTIAYDHRCTERKLLPRTNLPVVCSLVHGIIGQSRAQLVYSRGRT